MTPPDPIGSPEEMTPVDVARHVRHALLREVGLLLELGVDRTTIIEGTAGLLLAIRRRGQELFTERQSAA